MLYSDKWLNYNSYELSAQKIYYKEDLQMKDIEKLTTQIGEFVYTEIEKIKDIDYIKENDEFIGFTAIMQSGKQYLIAVSEVE